MNDPELFELCKEVEKRTGWGQYGDEGLHYFDSRPVVPLYTTDYLLEKLEPIRYGMTPKDVGPLALHVYIREDTWAANITGANFIAHQGDDASTPLKALLKLVVALDDAGERK